MVVEILSAIGERLRAERERLLMTQSDFAAVAEAAGVPGATRQSQARYEKGVAAPSCPYLAALAPVGVDVLYVLTGQRGVQPVAPALRDGEAELLEGYRALNAREKLGVKALIAGMAPAAGGVNVQVNGGTTGHVVTGGHVVIEAPAVATRRRVAKAVGK